MLTSSQVPVTPAMAQKLQSAPPQLRKQAQDMESLFINTLVSQMFSGLNARNGFGGGYAEETWRSMQSEQISNQIAKSGGVGLADSILGELISLQEAAGSAQTASQSR